ncbi:hypothetical protein EJB05_21707, partial [Eragrostis curvula]
MARKKVTLKLIADRSARCVTLKKRRASLMKKAHELATLCGVDACVVVYGEGGAYPPETFPPSSVVAARVLNRFKDLLEMEQHKKMLDMEAFLKQRTDKIKAQLEKAQRENDKREAALLLSGAIDGRRPITDLSTDELTILGQTVNARLKSIDEHIQKLPGQGHSNPLMALHLSLASLPPPPPMVPYTASAGVGHMDVKAEGVQGQLVDVKTEGVGGGGKTEVHAPLDGAQGRLVNVKTEGFGGGSGSFGGDAAGPSTSEGVGDTDIPQAQLSNTFAGFTWSPQDVMPLPSAGCKEKLRRKSSHLELQCP